MAQVSHCERGRTSVKCYAMMLRLLSWSFIALSLAIPSRAQEKVGAVLGRVTDATGAAAPNVQIRSVNRDTGIQAQIERELRRERIQFALKYTF